MRKIWFLGLLSLFFISDPKAATSPIDFGFYETAVAQNWFMPEKNDVVKVEVIKEVYKNPELADKFLPTSDGYCVSFVQAHGFSKYSGDAEEWWVYMNSSTPEIGSVVVLNEGEIGHLALVLYFDEDVIFIVEQNYKGRGVVSYRTINRDYSRIIGFIKKS